MFSSCFFITSLSLGNAGNALWFCQNFYFILFFLFFRRQGFRMITFDRQAGPLQNFNRSHIMVIGRSVSFSDPARGVGRPKHPKIPELICLNSILEMPSTLSVKSLLVVGFHTHTHTHTDTFYATHVSILVTASENQ